MARILEIKTSEILKTELLYCKPSKNETSEENYFCVKTDSFETCTPLELIDLATWLLKEAANKL